MAVSDWSEHPELNVRLGDIPLNGPFGAIIAELMAQIKAKLDGQDAAIGEWTGEDMGSVTLRGAIESLGGGLEDVETSIGSWTDPDEQTTLCAAIEALR